MFARMAKSAPAKKHLMMQIGQIKEALKAAEQAGPPPRLKGSRQLTCVRFISGLRVISGNAQNERLTSAFPPKADIRERPRNVGFVPKAAASKCSNAAPYSITSSAVASTPGEMVRPRGSFRERPARTDRTAFALGNISARESLQPAR